ncbi:glucose 1-dehydrogenase [Rhodopila sp.]|jgi:NAD(P)-dependent dehydrogenase (short-subunit alcohol dehydrogenase family)|uniref:glucose 1-dehydrogenase n=1 Tax=Rhodopila sp. TaxID=2480087 RepID=UPI002C9F5B1E|nr:glucose 1-dehydrogenase [Rhodopila sp.]HVZ07154.1 glucose 1-dehydrogenase [Rhodopila sp.]
MNFTDKVALITGGGGGIGRATALGFALRGAKVVVVDADAALGQGTVDVITQRGGTSAFVQADVTRSGSVRDYVEKTLALHGRIDCFFNNAGIEGKVVPIQDYDEEVFDQVIAVNLKGVFLGMRHVLPVMLKQESGVIVNTASVAGLFGAPGMPAYVASKHGVLGLTKVAAADVAAKGVRVNAVCPGPVETRMMRSLEAQRNPNDPQGVHAAYAAGIPTGRYATPEEIAGAVLYLCSDLSGDVTGTHIVIDGGRSGTGGVAPRRS